MLSILLEAGLGGVLELIQVAPVGAAIVIVVLFLRHQKEVAAAHAQAIAALSAEHRLAMEATSGALIRSLDAVVSAIQKQDVLLQKLVDKLEELERHVMECPGAVADELGRPAR